MKTTTFITVMSVVILFLPAASRAKPVEPSSHGECSLTMTGGEKEIWTLKVDPNRVSSDDAYLTSDGGVVYGFLAGKPFRAKPNGDDTKDNEKSHPGISLFLKGMVLELRRVEPDPGDPNSQDALTDTSGGFRVAFSGCTTSILTERPEVKLLMEWETFRRVKQKDDTHGWFGTSKYDTVVRSGFDYPTL
jgi:hypothetical protein